MSEIYFYLLTYFTYLGIQEKLTLLDALKIHFQKFFALSFLHLISNGLNGVNSNSFTKIVALLQDNL